jgi:hypothetical protein
MLWRKVVRVITYNKPVKQNLRDGFILLGLQHSHGAIKVELVVEIDLALFSHLLRYQLYSDKKNRRPNYTKNQNGLTKSLNKGD